ALHSLEGFFVEPHSKWPLNLDLLRTAVCAEDHPHHDGALILRFARFLGVLRVGRDQEPRCTHPAAYAIDPATKAAAGSRSYASAAADAYSATIASTDT